MKPEVELTDSDVDELRQLLTGVQTPTKSQQSPEPLAVPKPAEDPHTVHYWRARALLAENRLAAERGEELEYYPDWTCDTAGTVNWHLQGMDDRFTGYDLWVVQEKAGDSCKWYLEDEAGNELQTGQADYLFDGIQAVMNAWEDFVSENTDEYGKRIGEEEP